MRIKSNFDKEWYFHLGDIDVGEPLYKGISYISAKTDRYHIGPASKDYKITFGSYNNNIEHKMDRWEKVNLPHDYVIREIPDQKYNNALGFVPYKNAWYIKYFTLTEEDKNKRITLFFEGVATHATVYVNGCLMKHNFCGYTSFEVDITDVVNFGEGEKNVLSVYVNTQEHEGWWYEGGGIYRHVFLVKTDLVSVDLWGAYIKPKKTDGDIWVARTTVDVRNDDSVSHTYSVTGEIQDADGNTVAEAHADGETGAKSISQVAYDFTVSAPRLWSPDDPYQYTLVTRIVRDGECVDETATRFGFRTVEIDADRGLFINGKHYKIKGVCGHADCGLLGKAVPDNVHRYKVELMKAMGANGYRTSHYPQSEALMDALDANGFIVLDETRWFESTDEGKAQLEMLVKRDRNRPGVIFWSLGNEESVFYLETAGRRIFESLAETVRKLDDTRFITVGANMPIWVKNYDLMDVVGINYSLYNHEKIRSENPDKAMLATECCASGTTRGWYGDYDKTRAYLSAYDKDMDKEYLGREKTWKQLSEHDWVLGGYQWIAFEHRGEAEWPRVCSQSGAIDLFMQKKDAFYQNVSLWTDKPMVHLLPHWNFRGLENEQIKVWAYTNTEKLELFLNGRSCGVRNIEKYGHGEWTVAYEPGTLEVKAYNGGVEVASDKRVTSGEPARLVLTQDTADICANGEDIAILSCYAVDADGNEVYDAECEVSFSSSGDCSVYSTGSDISEHDTLFKPVRRMRAGRIGVAVKLGTDGSKMKVYASSKGLPIAVLELKTSSDSGK